MKQRKSQMMKFLSAMAVVSLAIVATAAHAETVPMTPALAKVIEAANKEGSIALRSTGTVFGGAEGAKAAEIAINQTFGTHLKIDWVPGPAYGPMAAIVYQEMQAGQKASTDVYTTTAVQATPYLDKNLFQKIDWAGIMPSRIKPDMVEAEGRMLRFQTVLPGVLYNIKAAPWVKDLNTTADLLKPEYKGKFYTTPFLAGFDVLLAPDVWGPQKTEDYVKKFSQQLAGLVGCEGTDRIASGEIPALAFDCSGGAGNRIQYRGKGVFDNKILSDMAQRREDYLAIPTNAPNPNAAILYTLYMMTHEGQEKLVFDIFGGDLYDFPDSHIHKEVSDAEAKGIKFIDVTIDWWRSHANLDAQNNALAKLVREK
jgi:ABC-type Fe3+ transport system substrate-binding protein